MRKFEAMLNWARHKIRTKTSSKLDAKLEFKCIMERLARDLKLYRISPQELIKVAHEQNLRVLLSNTLLFTDCFTIQGDKEREDPGDAHVPSELGNVPHPRFVHKRVHAASSEARFAFL